MKQLKTTRVLPCVLCVVVTSPHGALAQPTFKGFALPMLIETGKVPYHVKAMELNNDGKLDLVVANRGNIGDPANSPPSIQTFISDGMGGFTLGPVVTFPVVREPRHLATGDLNNDGFMDLVVADVDGKQIVALIRLASGGFEPTPRQFPVDVPVLSVDLGQINGGVDNFLDAVTGNYNFSFEGPIGRLFGDGFGNFGLKTLFFEGSNADRTVFAALNDADSNGVLDQVVTVQSPPGGIGGERPVGGFTLTGIDANNSNFVNSFLFRADTGNAPNRPAVVCIDDLNNNNIPDLIIPANGNPSLNFPMGKGIFVGFDGVHNQIVDNAQFIDSIFISTEPRSFDVAIADVNKDGTKDLVVTHRFLAPGNNNDLAGSVDLSVLFDNGSGTNTYDVDLFQFTFSELGPSTNPDLSVSPRFVELVDIDGDGDLDILTTRTQNNELSTSQPNGHIAIFRNLTILNADLNGDGVVDAADLAILLGNWGTCTCFSDIDGDVNGAVDATDLAILLANWGPQAAMAPPGEMAFDDTTLFKDGAGANQPSQNITTTTVPWVIAHFGFDSIASYTGWLELLTEDELFSHIAAMLDLISAP